MFELPELINLAQQINGVLQGKLIKSGNLGNSPHKFVWYNRSHDEFAELTRGKTVGLASVRGRWLFIPINPGYVLVLGEFGGKALYHQAGSKLPKKYHLVLTFEDETFFTVTTQMWGAMELYEKGQEMEREYIKEMRPTPVEPTFNWEYMRELVDSLQEGKKRSVKGLLTQEQLIPGLGNAIAQDIMFRAHLHPRHSIQDLDTKQRRTLYGAIIKTVQEIIEHGGRYDEYDLFNQRGGYVRLMDKQAAGNPCPECGNTVQKIQYLGGACYLCPVCQPIE